MQQGLENSGASRTKSAKAPVVAFAAAGVVLVIALLYGGYLALIASLPRVTVATNPEQIQEIDPEVQALHFEGISDSDLDELPELTVLKSPGFFSCTNLRGPGLRNLARVRNITGIHIRDCPNLDDSAIEAIQVLTNLESFWVIGPTKLTDAGILGLANLRGLRDLHLDDCQGVTIQGLQALKKLNPELVIYGDKGDALRSVAAKETSSNAHSNRR